MTGGQLTIGAKDRGAKDRGANDRGAKDRGANDPDPVKSYGDPEFGRFGTACCMLILSMDDSAEYVPCSDHYCDWSIVVSRCSVAVRI